VLLVKVTCLIYVFWKKHLEDALENKNSEKLALKKIPNKNKHAHNYNTKNITKRTQSLCRKRNFLLYECTCIYCYLFLLHEKGSYFK